MIRMFERKVVDKPSRTIYIRDVPDTSYGMRTISTPRFREIKEAFFTFPWRVGAEGGVKTRIASSDHLQKTGA